MHTIRIGERVIGPGERVFVIAEAGVNHNGDPDLAFQLVDAAADAGADAVKFQTFRADRLASRLAPKAQYQLESTDASESQADMLRRLELDRATLERIRRRSLDRAILFLSTPFDEESADLLDELGVPAFKVPSGELTNWPLLRHVAAKGKPVLLSTGMGHLGEVDEAVRVVRAAGCQELALLHCVTGYPAPAAEANLRVMRTMAEAFEVPVGYSDHTLGLTIALAAAALGACVIEKHFTLDRSLPGPDHRASLEPKELRDLIAGIHEVEAALGDGVKRPMPSEAANRSVVRRSLAAATDIPAGTVLEPHLLRALRPATGLAPTLADEIVGRRTCRALSAGELLGWGDLE